MQRVGGGLIEMEGMMLFLGVMTVIGVVWISIRAKQEKDKCLHNAPRLVDTEPPESD